MDYDGRITNQLLTNYIVAPSPFPVEGEGSSRDLTPEYFYCKHKRLKILSPLSKTNTTP